MKPAIDRLMEKAEQVTESGCIIWLGRLNGKGYATTGMRVPGRPMAYRAAFLASGGTIPEGYELDHKCRVRCCINPLHLEPVTHLENVRRGNAGLAIKLRTKCPQGHEYSGTNKSGARICAVCIRRSSAEFHKRKKLKQGNRP